MYLAAELIITHKDLKHMVKNTKRYFSLEESKNKPPNKEVNCIMWTLIKTLLIYCP